MDRYETNWNFPEIFEIDSKLIFKNKCFGFTISTEWTHRLFPALSFDNRSRSGGYNQLNKQFIIHMSLLPWYSKSEMIMNGNLRITEIQAKWLTFIESHPSEVYSLKIEANERFTQKNLDFETCKILIIWPINEIRK